MLEDTLKALPVIDQVANGGNLLLMKAMIPYLPQAGQRFLALYAKAAEITNLMGFYRSSPDLGACAGCEAAASPEEMLSDIRCFCGRQEQEAIDQYIQMMQIMQLCQALQHTDGSPDMLKNLLPPEQQSMFEACHSMMQPQ